MVQQLLLDIHLESPSLQTSTLKYWLLKETVPDHLNKNRLHPHHHSAHLANFTFHYVTVMMVYIFCLPHRNAYTTTPRLCCFLSRYSLHLAHWDQWINAIIWQLLSMTITREHPQSFYIPLLFLALFFCWGHCGNQDGWVRPEKNPDRRAGRPPLWLWDYFSSKCYSDRKFDPESSDAFWARGCIKCQSSSSWE